MSILRFKYVTNKKIWGEEKWIISAHENGMSYITGGQYDKMSLKNFFISYKGLLGIKDKEFPLLVKIIDANDDLSIQVHPNNEYAREYENTLGKSESWYILDSKDANIVVGQNAKSKKELEQAIKDDNVMAYMNTFNIDAGDFFNIYPGCVHAIRKGTKLLEIQQSSDITYRLYDYKRKDSNGNLRELHINKSLDVITYSQAEVGQDFKCEDYEGYKSIELSNNEYFKIVKLEINQEVVIPKQDKYYMVILVEGEILINKEPLKLEEGVIVLVSTGVKLEGKGSVIVSTSK